MTLVQDAFNLHLTDLIKQATVLLNADGSKKVDEDGVKIPLDNLLFSCSTSTEFVNCVLNMLKSDKTYPFIFIPSGDNIKYGVSSNKNEIPCEIGELFICNLSNKNMLADARDMHSFKTILFPVKEALETVLRGNAWAYMNYKEVSLAFEQHHCYTKDAAAFQDRLDVIIVKDIKLKLKQC